AETIRAHFVSLFSSLHYALTQNLRLAELRDAMEQARAIQISLLPPGRRRFGRFDIAAISIPAQHVGGDLYDFQELDPQNLAVTIADSAGHGLPAALQARDVITGLRMALEPEIQPDQVVGRLNRVIHSSGLGSRFVSLVFGILGNDGYFRYVNAGHPAPLMRDASGFRELESSGMI